MNVEQQAKEHQKALNLFVKEVRRRILKSARYDPNPAVIHGHLMALNIFMKTYDRWGGNDNGKK